MGQSAELLYSSGCNQDVNAIQFSEGSDSPFYFITVSNEG
jgi:hypothetical protein